MPELPPELVAAILAEPESDDPRLVAADWYDDAGDSDRAEFIRVQCRIARFEGSHRRPKDASAQFLREQLLLRDHQKRWLSESGLLPNHEHWQILFRRGFIHSLLARGPITLADLASIPKAAPVLATLRGNQIQGELPEDWLEQLSALRNMREIAIAIDLTEMTWELLKPLASLIWLRHVSIADAELQDDLITPELRDRLRIAREQFQSQNSSEAQRFATLREQIGGIRSTTSRLDRLWTGPPPLHSLKLARTLTTLRRVFVRPQNEDDLAAIADLSMLRSLSLDASLPETPRLLAPLTGLREVVLWAEHSLDIGGLGDWLATQTQLETLKLTGEPMLNPTRLLIGLHRCPKLRVLHMPTLTIPIDMLEQMRLPELLELDAGIETPGSLDWLGNFPRLRTIHLRTPDDPQIAQAFREHGIEVLPTLPTRTEEPVAMQNGHHLGLAHGVRLRVPAGLDRVEPAHSPHAIGTDIEALAAWQEFGPGDEWPDLRWLGPARIWLERIDAPTGTQNARRWLMGPATPYRVVTWSTFVKIATACHIHPRMLKWYDGECLSSFQGVRAVWMGKRQVLRLIAEFPVGRVTPWDKILQAMVASVRVPAGF